MDKKSLLQQLFQKIENDLNTARAAATATAQGATHEESKAEGSKDTRATEASYLARGQAMRVEELEETLNRLRFMRTEKFDIDTPISAGAVVCLENEKAVQRWYYLVVAGGGYELDSGKKKITTITPQSPLGKSLIEKQVSDEIEFRVGGKMQIFDIIDVY